MGGRSIARALARVQSGETTFDGFVRETAEDWRRLSQETFRRWPLPAAVERQDVEQEMLMAAWRATGDYDATRGTTIEQRVVWCAVTDARKFLHRQRNSYRRDARAPGRFEVRQEASDPEPTVEARQEEVADARRQLAFAFGTPRVSGVARDVLLVVVMCGADLERASAEVWADRELASRANLTDPQAARRLVDRVVAMVNKAATRRRET